jgi:hypothetical protein
MIACPLLGLVHKALEVVVELLPIHPPNPSSADLDRGQVPGADECIDLRHADTCAELNGWPIGGHDPRGLHPTGRSHITITACKDRKEGCDDNERLGSLPGSKRSHRGVRWP